ncbi:hypothetical protein ACSMXN_15975 [Jatrophihabitans sp. DSM 45814]
MSYEIRPGRPDDDSSRHERPIYDEHIVINGASTGEPTFGRPADGGMANGGVFQPVNTGPELSQVVLRRYLVTRAIGASVVRTVHWFGIAVLVLAVLVWFAGVEWLAILIGLAAIFILLTRAALSAIQRRISGVDGMGPAAREVDKLVGQTRKGLRSELRRIGLPAAPWGPTLVGLRLIRPTKRAETVQKLTKFDLTQVVPSSTLDELDLVLRNSKIV